MAPAWGQLTPAGAAPSAVHPPCAAEGTLNTIRAASTVGHTAIDPRGPVAHAGSPDAAGVTPWDHRGVTLAPEEAPVHAAVAASLFVPDNMPRTA